jgi:hypothetical protein
VAELSEKFAPFRRPDLVLIAWSVLENHVLLGIKPWWSSALDYMW